MTYAEAIVLGVVQGLGEFLPISSSAHLVLVPWLLGWEYHGLTFDVALHMGTLLALFLFFGKDFWKLLRIGIKEQGRTKDSAFFWMILAASIPAAVVGYTFADALNTIVRQQIGLIAGALAVAGVLLVVIDRFAAKKRDIEQANWSDVLLVGLMQALALLPGVSRSGATIGGGLLVGFTREAAARLSFFLSAPIILGAGVFQMRHLEVAQIDGPFIVGVLVAAGVGYASIGFLLNYLKKGNVALFAWYRIAVAVLVIITLAVRRG